MKRVLLIVIAGCLLFAASAQAKEGFYLGAFIPSESISGDAGNGVSSGSGWGIRAGLGFNRYLAIEGDYTTTKHDVGATSVDLNGLAADLKLNFPLTSLDSAQVMTLEPYLLGGYQHYEMTTTPTVKGDGTQWGLGVELYLFQELSVNAGWTTSHVTFKDGTSRSGDVQRIDFGIIYHFI